MPNDSIEEALKEVYALAPNDDVALNTLELSHPALPDSIYMVQDRVAHTFTLEDLTTVEFEPVPFRITLPTSGNDGLQEINFSIDNIDRRITDFLDLIDTVSGSVEMTYRPYLPSDPTKPQMTPPLVLVMTEVRVTSIEVSGRATFANIVNLKYPTQYYDRKRFPGLGG